MHAHERVKRAIFNMKKKLCLKIEQNLFKARKAFIRAVGAQNLF